MGGRDGPRLAYSARCRLPCPSVLNGWNKGQGTVDCGPFAGRDAENGMRTSCDHEILRS